MPADGQGFGGDAREYGSGRSKGAKILDALANPVGSQVTTRSDKSKEISSNVLVVLDYAHADHLPIRPILWLNLIAGDSSVCPLVCSCRFLFLPPKLGYSRLDKFVIN